MKKAFVLFLALALLLSFCACGDTTPDTSPDTTDNPTSDTAEEPKGNVELTPTPDKDDKPYTETKGEDENTPETDGEGDTTTSTPSEDPSTPETDNKDDQNEDKDTPSKPSDGTTTTKPNNKDDKDDKDNKEDEDEKDDDKTTTSKPSGGTTEPAKKGWLDKSLLTYTSEDIGKVIGYDALLQQDVTVVDVKNAVNGEGLKGVEVVLSNFTCVSTVECKYCHEMPCPDGGGTKCSEYNVRLDTSKTCQTCHRPRGNGYNGTCYITIDWNNGGKLICHHYD